LNSSFIPIRLMGDELFHADRWTAATQTRRRSRSPFAILGSRLKPCKLCVTSVSRREAYWNHVLLRYYAANSGNSLPTFGTTSETSVKNYHYSLRNTPETRGSRFIYYAQYLIIKRQQEARYIRRVRNPLYKFSKKI
jgi:hypothetical protein